MSYVLIFNAEAEKEYSARIELQFYQEQSKKLSIDEVKKQIDILV